MNDFLKSSKVRLALFTLGAGATLVLVFWFGVVVGSRELAFRMRFGENYEHNFFGVAAAPSGSATLFLSGIAGVGAPPNVHGATGKVIDLASTSFSIVDMDGDEFSIVVPGGAIVRGGVGTTTPGGLQMGDVVAVIGAPNASGQIQARFIRVLAVAPPPAATDTVSP